MSEEQSERPKTKQVRRAIWIIFGALVFVGTAIGPAWLLKLSCSEERPQPVPNYFARDSKPSEHRSRAQENEALYTILFGEGPTARIEQIQKANRRGDARKDQGWWRGFLCEINGSDYAIAAFTFYLFLSTLLLWYATEKAIAKGEDSSAKRAEESKLALNAAGEANEIARETGRDQVRAYLIVKYVLLYLEHESTRITIKIVNAGQSPVRWVETEGNAHILETLDTKSDEVPLNPKGASKLRWSIDPEREGGEYPCEVTANKTALLSMAADARDRRRSLVIQGTVRWETIFGETFESTFFAWGIPENPRIEMTKQGYVLHPQRLSLPGGANTPTFRLMQGPDNQ